MTNKNHYELQGKPFNAFVDIESQNTVSIKKTKFSKPILISLASITEFGIKSKLGQASLFFSYMDSNSQQKEQFIAVNFFDSEALRLCNDLKQKFLSGTKWQNKFFELAERTSGSPGVYALPITVYLNALLRKSYVKR